MLFALTDSFFYPVKALLLQDKGLFKLAEQRAGAPNIVAVPFEPDDELLLLGDALSPLRDVPVGKLEMLRRKSPVDKRKHIA